MAAPGSSPYTPQGGPAATTPPRYTTYTEYLGDVLKVDPEYEICHHLQGELLSNNRQMLPRGTLGFLRVAADGKLVHSSKHSMFNPLVDFKRTLTTFDKSIEYQIVTLELTMPYPPPAVMDILGLELDIGPTAWKNLCDPDQKSIPWIRGGNFVRVGADTVMILESSPKARPKTALILFRSLGKRYGNLASPNALNEDKPSTLPRQKPKNSSEPSLPVSWVIDAVCNPRGYGSGNDLFACLQALLGWRAHEESFDIARFRVLLRSKAHKQNYAAHDSMFKVSNSELQSLWYHLRDRVDEWRMTLHALPTFVEYNFNTLDGDFQREYKLVQGTYERNVLELELLEAKVRDHLDMIRSAKSMEMAQLSIYESKRVLLLTVLAFVFIPISLATSIYGMNIQQINSSGHDIRTFVYTAIGLLAATLVFWASISIIAVQLRRHATRRKLGSARKKTIYG